MFEFSACKSSLTNWRFEFFSNYIARKMVTQCVSYNARVGDNKRIGIYMIDNTAGI